MEPNIIIIGKYMGVDLSDGMYVNKNDNVLMLNGDRVSANRQ